MKQAGGEFDAAEHLMAEAEQALHETVTARAQARRERYAARQAHERPPRPWAGSSAA